MFRIQFWAESDETKSGRKKIRNELQVDGDMAEAVSRLNDVLAEQDADAVSALARIQITQESETDDEGFSLS